jgi:rare lipoprotein A
VRVNDRGPFHADRIIDLSYAAAWKLGYVEAGSARVEVESLLPGAPVTVPELTTVAVSAPDVHVAGAADIRVQLGAFSSRDGAENLRSRVQKEVNWLGDAIQIVPGGSMFRLQLGPYRTQEEARSIADRIQAELGIRPVIVGR